MRKALDFYYITGISIGFVFAATLLSACAGLGRTDSWISTQTESKLPTKILPTEACPITEPEWVKPPEDEAIPSSPVFGYYYTNEDRSILASARWTDVEDFPLRAGKEGNKVGWFRPAGEELMITGHRLDEKAPPLDAHVPCCYPTRFQATGLIFPTEGCWEVTAQAAESSLSFVVRVEH